MCALERACDKSERPPDFAQNFQYFVRVSCKGFVGIFFIRSHMQEFTERSPSSSS